MGVGRKSVRGSCDLHHCRATKNSRGTSMEWSAGVWEGVQECYLPCYCETKR